MKIRTANNTDSENIVQLVKDGLKEFGFDYSPETSESDLLDIEGEYIKNGGTFLVLENKKNELIATGALIKLSNNQYKIRKMYVSKSYRRKGYGKRMLDELIAFAHKNKALSVVLETSNAMVSAIALYKTYGFTEMDQYQDSPRCDVTMIKRI